MSEPQGGAVTVGYVAAPVPLLAVPLLAGAAGEAVDDRTLRFLLARSLAEEEEEEQRKAQVEELLMQDVCFLTRDGRGFHSFWVRTSTFRQAYDKI